MLTNRYVVLYGKDVTVLNFEAKVVFSLPNV